MTTNWLGTPPPSDDEASSCDWGGCNDDATTWRWSPRNSMWLSVCPHHAARADLTPGYVPWGQGYTKESTDG